MFYMRLEFLFVNQYRMDKIIQHNFKKAFSDKEIARLCDGKVKIITYKDLKDYKDIDDVLQPYNAVILLYETKPNYGHWVALHKVDSKTIEFFDSYGLKPDEHLKLVPPKYRHELGEDYPILTEMITNAGYDLLFNDVKLQKIKDDMSTCGRWAGIRLSCKRLHLKDFVNLFRNQKMQPDWYITVMTMYI